MQSKVTASGLDDVVVAHTEMSSVDGEAGRLVIRGYEVEVLAQATGFEGVIGLLLEGELPAAARQKEIEVRLGAARGEVYATVAQAAVAIAHGGVAGHAGLTPSSGMDAVRAGLAALSVEGLTPEDASYRVIAAAAVAASAWNRARRGEDPRAPDPRRTHAADFLAMATGGTDPAAAKALDAYLVTVADHGLNASTFTARVVASTGSDLASAATAGVCALKGPLHGGAPGPVLDMLDAIGAPANAAAWIEAELASGQRIMGMGHRIYRVRDPRAAVLEAATRELAKTRETPRLALARAVEDVARSALAAKYPNRPLQANVEFFTAVLLDAVGLPRELFSPTFAVARVLGWTAHFYEQRGVGRLIRPASVYVGP